MGSEVLYHGAGKRETYEEFVEKFKPKKTTDDCMTPAPVYEAVADWVANEYGLDRADFVRPFWPGGDYENFDYPEGCVVVDNPPFSMLSRIIDFYFARGLRFFLFAPSLTQLCTLRKREACYVCVGASVIYENGAKVSTSFMTNLEDGVVVRSAPSLYAKLLAVDKERQSANSLPRYTYPDYVLSAAMVNNFSKYDTEFSLNRMDTSPISCLDSQKQFKKGVFGGGLLLSEKAAAEKAAAEKAAAEKAAAEKRDAIVWELSDREREIIKNLGKRDD